MICEEFPNFFLYLSNALWFLLSGSAAGWGALDDAAVVKVHKIHSLILFMKIYLLIRSVFNLTTIKS